MATLLECTLSCNACWGKRPRGSVLGRNGFLPEVDYWHVWTPMGMHGVLSCICDATPHLENGSARVPMKVVTSCDKLRVGA